MISPIMLDAGPLGRLSKPIPLPEIDLWLAALIRAGVQVIVPEITDFEIRRELLRAKLQRSIDALDYLKGRLIYNPITTPAMLRASELWADARRAGRPTADPKELDCDVILAAQALEAGAIVATENAGHIGRYVTARHWRQITPP